VPTDGGSTPLERTPPTFEEFLQKRGFDVRTRGAFLRRMFVTCWGEPGFHLFWRLWNPLYGYGLFRLYLLLGGARRPLVASLIVFASCGFFLHDLPVAASTHRLGITTTLSFVVFWALASISRALSPRLGQQTWARSANAAMNVACVVAGLSIGALVGARLL
jgi:hypothetical protein